MFCGLMFFKVLSIFSVSQGVGLGVLAILTLVSRSNLSQKVVDPRFPQPGDPGVSGSTGRSIFTGTPSSMFFGCPEMAGS